MMALHLGANLQTIAFPLNSPATLTLNSPLKLQIQKPTTPLTHTIQTPLSSISLNCLSKFPKGSQTTTKRQTMVVSLGPGKFYGSSLPRPRIYTDTKFNPERVDSPVPVLDPLLSWAYEAHWSMGGLSFKRLRLQGRIEGNVKRLKAQRKKLLKDTPDRSLNLKKSLRGDEDDEDVSPPPAPVAVKRRRFLDLNDDDDTESENKGDDEEEVTVAKRKKKRVLRNGAVRKLGDDFERVAKNSGLVRKRGRNFSDGIGSDVKKMVEEVNDEPESEEDKKKTEAQNGRSRTSPRLARRGRY
ncbi:hypothetical protein ERO13_D04G142900v2 [Gossypium hirsutum]|uniref:Uncharacterized protein n=1 Tax=Gossypium hirsutum TaxID=3635 RepID=A0A1U8IPH5_GOSHI|nr:uncharacterized protein LOC107898963 [Gossypium hirsutum]KAG4152786.1 hypothetical protein ERO13_D04G142900v2 [Gossypium hirsutum]